MRMVREIRKRDLSLRCSRVPAPVEVAASGLLQWRLEVAEMQTMCSQSHQGANLSLGPFFTSQGHNVFPIFREHAHSSHMGDLLCILTLATPCQLR